MTMRMRPASALDRPWPILAVLFAVLGVAWYVLSRPDTHEVRVAFSAALNVPEGALVQAAGVAVGTATDIRYQDGQATMRLKLEDDVWPLPKGTTARIRLSSVSGNVNRRIELVLGARDAPALPEGAVIGTAEPKPVELDDVFNTLDPATRQDLQGALRNTADTLTGHARELGRGIRRLGDTVPEAGGLITDLEASERQLSSLVRNGDRVTRILAGKQERVGQTIDLAAATFATFGQNSREMQRTLDELPPALAQISGTTSRLAGSLGEVTGLVRDLAPGSRQLVPTARTLAPTLALLRPTARDASQLVANLTRNAPGIRRLLTRGTPFVKDLAPAVRQLAPIAGCLRPYAPEVAGTLSNWASWNAGYDANGNVARISPDVTGLGNFGDSPDVPATEWEKFGLRYGGLRPPGWIGGRPEYDDACGVGKHAVDPTNEIGD